MNYDTLTIDTAGSIATVTLNRPEVRNAFNEQAIAELTAAFTALGQVDGIRVIVLAANGTAYCAGADLNWMKKMAGYSEEENRADAMQLANMLRIIYACPKPVVAKVHGDCFGGGVGLAAACDIAIAADDAHFCLSEVKLGLIPATISPYVIKAMGENAARRYFLTAERFNAREALRIGLVHDIATAATLDGQVDAIANALAANSPNAVRQAKALVSEIAGQPVTDTLIADTAHRIAQIRASGEGREGVAAFLEKRKPAWLN
ncbi:enoyl-CoA hydratase/isomerase family protein [Massilia dura]|uniref:Enoyl-CoA hydratase/isomerase family protein n=1 Tax=Pseudoduganella dura TaxID=321982 RepID=A0A6I3XPD1_9BURK|nr:enoyl-CoA hydratase/isomerase family protein [Pseudoduganella dura]MUI13605.1 enoyl-CoA hydratase/isomerase family protein [Pseudoduganella dura]GGX74030.1 enoyl-CoA hydratase [Pseudoduganella dura]